MGGGFFGGRGGYGGPGQQKNVFGGPPNLQDAMMMMIQGWMQGQQKRQAEQEQSTLAQIMGQPQPEETAPEDYYKQQVDQLLSSPLSPQVKAQGLQALKARQELTAPSAEKEPKRIKLDFWDDKGKKRSLMVPESAYSSVADRIVSAGGVLEAPKEEKWETKQALLNGKPVFAQVSDKGNTRLLNGSLEPIAQGLKFTVDKEGNIVFQQGAGAGMSTPGNVPLSPVTRKDIEKEAIAANDELARLESIAATLDDKFLTTGGKAEAWWSNMKDMTGLGDLEPEERKNLTDFSDFTRKTVENANLYIKRITGAQMSEAEAKRLLLAVPVFDAGWFSGDGPTKFKSKMRSTMESLKMAKARHNYYLTQGLSVEDIAKDKAISLGSMKQKINELGNEFMQKFKAENPGAKDSEIKSMVAAELKRTFGI